MNTLANAVTRALGLGRVTDMEEQAATAQDIVMMTREADDDGVLNERERSIILNALALGHRTARHVMVPRLRVAYLDARRSMEENRRVVNEHLYSRMPLCDGGLDKVVGIVPVTEFMVAYYGHGDSHVLRLICRPAVFVPDKTRVDKLLTTLLDANSKMVVVVDEYGGVEGIITVDDVVDELLGAGAAVRREAVGTVPLPHLPPDPRPFTVLGGTPVHELAAMLGREGWGEHPDVVTVGGLLVNRLDRVPEPGEELSVDGVVLHVAASDGRAVRRVDIIPQIAEPPPDAGHSDAPPKG